MLDHQHSLRVLVGGPWDPAAQAYLERKLAEGKTPREARRALERHPANLVHRRLYLWAENTLLETASCHRSAEWLVGMRYLSEESLAGLYAPRGTAPDLPAASEVVPLTTR